MKEAFHHDFQSTENLGFFSIYLECDSVSLFLQVQVHLVKVHEPIRVQIADWSRQCNPDIFGKMPSSQDSIKEVAENGEKSADYKMQPWRSMLLT